MFWKKKKENTEVKKAEVDETVYHLGCIGLEESMEGQAIIEQLKLYTDLKVELEFTPMRNLSLGKNLEIIGVNIGSFFVPYTYKHVNSINLRKVQASSLLVIQYTDETAHPRYRKLNVFNEEDRNKSLHLDLLLDLKCEYKDYLVVSSYAPIVGRNFSRKIKKTLDSNIRLNHLYGEQYFPRILNVYLEEMSGSRGYV